MMQKRPCVYILASRRNRPLYIGVTVILGAAFTSIGYTLFPTEFMIVPSIT